MSAACQHQHRAVELRTGGARLLRIVACADCGEILGAPIGRAQPIEKRHLRSRRIDSRASPHFSTSERSIVVTMGQRVPQPNGSGTPPNNSRCIARGSE